MLENDQVLLRAYARDRCEASFYQDQDGNWRRAVPAGAVAKLPDVIDNLRASTAAAK